MKIFNLILLNFYFLQLISLLFGMHPGEGPSGSQPGGMHPGEGSGSQPGGMHPGEGSGSQPGGMYPGEGSGSQPGGMYPGEGSGSQPGGMYQGEGSGTQQPVEEDEFTQIKGLISPMLETVGDNRILQGIVPRMLNNPDRIEAITNVRKQYYNLVYAYIELLGSNNAIDENIPHLF
uniref:Uncharacterized protein n=1 Tax=Meloidogyne enterolobii TaxID=390850 RepID=A0A6V7VA34_MELEN|nr:unnamed protein product [Meloidogyne enterolobii]